MNPGINHQCPEVLGQDFPTKTGRSRASRQAYLTYPHHPYLRGRLRVFLTVDLRLLNGYRIQTLLLVVTAQGH